MEVQAIKCPSCGANVDWDGSSRVVMCAYCGTEIAMGQDASADGTAPVDPKVLEVELRHQRREERHERHERHREERHARHEQHRQERHERRDKRYEDLMGTFL